MNDLALIAALVKTTLLEISRQQRGLGEGLLVAAPGDKEGKPNNSVQYLLDGSEALAQLAEQCNEIESLIPSDAQTKSD